MQSSETTTPVTPQILTRPAFFRLTESCRDYALELAQHDQTRVNLRQCHQFNAWFADVRAFAPLAAPLQSVKPARPVARWQIMTLVVVLGLILFFAFGTRLPRLVNISFLTSYFFFLLMLYFVPERLYGTTIEMIEGKVLRVVDALEALLMTGEMGFTEAAFFQAKANLQDARKELRQQIDLAHRRWR